MTPADLDAAMTAALRHLDIDRFETLAAEADRQAGHLAQQLEQPRALLGAALYYANRGMPVFPCQPGGKQPATPHGFKDASTDPDRIRAWWHATPAANIGHPTGLKYDVIDIDGPAGYRSLAELKAEHLFPDRYEGRVLTPRGGMHYYIPAAGDGNAGGVLPGIDYRGKGGYVLAPPSRSSSNGRRWEWCNPLSTDGYQTVYTWEAGQ